MTDMTTATPSNDLTHHARLDDEDEESVEGCPDCGGELAEFEGMLRCSTCKTLFDDL